MIFGSKQRIFLVKVKNLISVILFYQDENDDDDDWNFCKVVGVCFMFLVICCEDDIVLYVFFFIKEYIKNFDWRYRDVVVMVFGCILEGLEFNQFKLLVIQVKLREFWGGKRDIYCFFKFFV